MDHEIIWAQTALDDLEAITRHIAQDDPVRATQVGDEIIRHVEILRSFPQIGPKYERARDGQTRQVVCGSYHIFYHVRQEEHIVDILHVWHGARQDPDL